MKDVTLELYRTGLEDCAGREILESETGKIYKMVAGLPHTVTVKGEPQAPIHDFRIISLAEQLRYDPGDYPDGFDPERYNLEESPKKWTNGLSPIRSFLKLIYKPGIHARYEHIASNRK